MKLFCYYVLLSPSTFFQGNDHSFASFHVTIHFSFLPMSIYRLRSHIFATLLLMKFVLDSMESVKEKSSWRTLATKGVTNISAENLYWFTFLFAIFFSTTSRSVVMESVVWRLTSVEERVPKVFFFYCGNSNQLGMLEWVALYQFIWAPLVMSMEDLKILL